MIIYATKTPLKKNNWPSHRKTSQRSYPKTERRWRRVPCRRHASLPGFRRERPSRGRRGGAGRFFGGECVAAGAARWGRRSFGNDVFWGHQSGWKWGDEAWKLRDLTHEGWTCVAKLVSKNSNTCWAGGKHLKLILSHFHGRKLNQKTYKNTT